MRRHTQAPSAGSTTRGPTRTRRTLFGLACLCVLGLAAFLGSGAPSAAAQACPNEAFRSGPSANLPDCRAYEMVSPPEKEGQEVNFIFEGGSGPAPTAAANGDSAIFASINGTFGQPASGGVASQFLSRRGASGWSTEGISPPLGPYNTLAFAAFQAFTEDLDKGILRSGWEPPLTADAPAGTTNLYLHDTVSGSNQLLSLGAPAEAHNINFNTVGLSADAGHVVFSSPPELTADSAAAVSPYLYDWSAATGTLSLVGRLPDNTVSSNAVTIGGPRWRRPVSANGSRVFFHEGGGGECGACVRVNDATTQLISETGSFQVASSDGSLAYVTEGEDLKLYNLNTDVLSPSIAGEVQGVLGASADGSRVYFVSKEALALGATGGENNLYLWTQGAGFQFIATGNTSSVFTNNWATTKPSSRITPDGMHLAFTANNSLTGYPDEGKSEAYLYSAATGELVCASCNPSGAPATTGGFLTGGGIELPFLSRNLSDDGSQLFFTTNEALVPRDSNSWEDVYEYDAASGEVALISSGTDAAPLKVRFEASASGNDAFFLTRERLVGSDKDEAVDLYDARVGGGLASQHPSSSPPCTGDACRSASSPIPSQASAASAGFVGKGNISAKQNCNKLGKEAKKLSKRAKRLRKNAKKVKKAGKSSRAKKLNKKSNRLAKQARNKSKSAKKCRKRNKGASK